MVIGPIGQPMNAIAYNFRGRRCTLKILVESADRTREAAQLEPLLRLIREAKDGAEIR